MSDGDFQAAYDRVRSRYTDEAWIGLTPRQVTEEVYREIRRMDAERAQAAIPPKAVPNADCTT